MDMLRKDFSHNPTSIDIERSKFSRNSGLKTTLNAGQLIPIYIDEVLPGDTFKIDNSYLCRMLTPIFPVMDNAYLDFFWFFVPNRIVWDHWKEFCGENTSGPWTQEVQYQVPQLKFDNQALYYFEEYGAGYSLSNYLGVPAYLQDAELTVSDLPNRAYRLIWNEFFRSENLQSPIPVYTDDTDRSFGYDGKYGLEILPVCKRHDLFTSALPQPQKGDSVFIPVLESAPVSGVDDAIRVLDDNDVEYRMYYDASAGGVLTVTKDSAPYNPSSSTNIRLADETLISDLTQASSVSINELRQAFQIQRLLEKDARGGTRYRELLLSHFGVISPDSRVQVPEYLGGFSNPINMDQVLQTSATDQVSPQGNTAAYSLTSGSEAGFTKSFTEHGLIMGLACIRVEHTYAQGVPRYLFRKNRFDFYYPSLAHLGEQAILKREIMATGVKALDEEPFGYQEAWYDYRYKPNTMTGMFKPLQNYVDGGLELVESPLAKAWTFADFYKSRPSLGSQFLVEDPENVNKVIAVPTNLYPSDQQVYNNNHQFLLDVYFDCECVRPMPLYSIPGLIDHY